MSAVSGTWKGTILFLVTQIWWPRGYSTSFGTFDLLFGILCTCTSYLCCIRMHEPVLVSMRRPRRYSKKCTCTWLTLVSQSLVKFKKYFRLVDSDQNWNLYQWRPDVHSGRRARLNQAQFRYFRRIHLPSIPRNGWKVVQSSLQSWSDSKKAKKNLRQGF